MSQSPIGEIQSPASISTITGSTLGGFFVATISSPSTCYAQVVVSRRTLRFQLKRNATQQNLKCDTASELPRESPDKRPSVLNVARALSRSLSGSKGNAKMTPLHVVRENTIEDDHMMSLSGKDSEMGSLVESRSNERNLLERRETVLSEYDYKPCEDDVHGGVSGPDHTQRMQETVQEMEAAFIRENDLKALPQQRKNLWVSCFLTFGAYIFFVSSTHSKLRVHDI